MNIKKLFGSDIDSDVKLKLLARSQASNKTINPNESIFEGIEPSNFKGISELSSKTPVARMWTAVKLTRIENLIEYVEKTRELTHSQIKEAYINAGGSTQFRAGEPEFEFVDFQKENETETYTEQIQKIKETELSKKVYVIGNHEYNNLTKNSQPNQPIDIANPSNNIPGNIPSDLSSKVFNTELKNNDFLKPTAGITSISSKTEGSYGVLKRTTINFIVYNAYDLENIYMRFFMKPGAHVFIDFGWDTANLYDPEKLIEENKNLDEQIFGDNGFVKKSKGDLETIFGEVVKWDSKVRQDSSFECTIEIVSGNFALLDYSFALDSKSMLLKNINLFIIELVAKKLGKSFLSNTWSPSTTNAQQYSDYANTFASDIFSGETDVAKIPTDQVELGVYWQALSNNANKVSNNENLYISWGFFEDEILNDDYSFLYNTGLLSDGGDFNIKFDSSNSFVRFDDNLKKRQEVISLKGTNSKTDIKFLYPDNWSKSYSVNKGKVPDDYKVIDDNNPIRFSDDVKYTKPYTDLQKEEAILQWEYTNYGYQTRDVTRNTHLSEAERLSLGIKITPGPAYRNPKRNYNESGVDIGACGPISYDQFNAAQATGQQLPPDSLCLGPYDRVKNERLKITYDDVRAYRTRNGLQEGEVYRVGNHETSFYFPEKVLLDNYNVDLKLQRIPLRELFINVSLLKDAFDEKDTLNDVLKFILDKINVDSADVFNLQMYDPTGLGTTIEITDVNKSTNLSELKDGKFINTIEDNFLIYHIFEPSSNNSIVKNLDLSYKTPENGVQNLIAIENSSAQIPLFPEDASIDALNGYKIIDNTIEIGDQSAKKDVITLRYIPELSNLNIVKKRNSFFNTSNENPDNAVSKNIPSNINKKLKNFDDSKHGDKTGKELRNLLKTDSQASVPQTSTPQNIVDSTTPNALHQHFKTARNLEEYYFLKAKSDWYVDNSITIMDGISLNLSIYGISGLHPGNNFRIKYMPKKYFDNVFFRIVSITQNITPSGWSTDIEAQMLLRPQTKKDRNYLVSKPTITLSKNLLSNYIDANFLEEVLEPTIVDYNVLNYEIKYETRGGRSGRSIKRNFKPLIMLLDFSVINQLGLEKTETASWITTESNGYFGDLEYSSDYYESIYVLTVINKEARNYTGQIMWLAIDKEKVADKTKEEIYDICFKGTKADVQSILA
tara:strand:- start:4896 stop:8435 length:3540 start_codon:yes stop_codon:yes gene_type:complete